jgi:hypothetical protein
MATARIQRSVLEGGGLPPVCICCGNPATHGIRHWFRPQPTWWLFASPLVIVLLVALAVGLRTLDVPRFVSRILLLSILAVLIPVGGAIDLAVPVCSFHRNRLRYHELYLLLVVGILFAVGWATILAMVNERPDLNELILRWCLVGGPGLLLGSIALRFFTPRVIDSDYSHIDMTMVAPGFVETISQSGRSRLGFPTHSLGRPLRGDWTAVPRWVYIAAGVTAGLSVAMVVSCLGVSQLLRWQHQQQAREFHARVQSGKLFTPPQPAPRIPTQVGPRRSPPPSGNVASAPPVAIDSAAPGPSSIPAQPPPMAGAGSGPGSRAEMGIKGSTPGFEVTRAEDIQSDELLHVATENGWRTGRAVETTAGQVRIRLLGGGQSAGDWFPIDQVRFLRPPDIRAAMVKAGFGPPAAPFAPPLASNPPPAISPPAAAPTSPPPASPSPSPAANAKALRTWSDASGKFQIEAELVKIEDGHAVLKKSDGSLVRVALDKLSLADRLYAMAQSQ